MNLRNRILAAALALVATIPLTWFLLHMSAGSRLELRLALYLAVAVLILAGVAVGLLLPPVKGKRRK